LTNSTGFNHQAYLAAVQFCLTTNTHLDEALAWSDAAINMPFVGQKTFNTLSTKAQVLSKLNRKEEAGKVMETALALPGTTAIQIHGYARQLQVQKNQDDAMKLFRFNADHHGDEWPVHVGLARYYSWSGDYPKALEHAKKALGQAPDGLNKKSLESMIKSFSEGKAIDQ
jgi:tetratricopeptide (TPR) repeat protein